MNLLTHFERIYIINLRSRTDRRSQVSRELARVGVPPDGDRVRFFDGICPADAGGFPGIGARGCYLSHLGVLRDARDAGLRDVLILEDDVAFTPALARCGAAMTEALRGGDWDFAYPGHVEPAGARMIEPAWRDADGPLMCAHAYAVNGRVLAPLVAYLEACLTRAPGDPRGGPMHVDGALSMFRAAAPGCRTWLAEPTLARQRSSRSDIATGRWFDRTGPLRHLVSGLRGTREWLRRRSQTGA